MRPPHRLPEGSRAAPRRPCRWPPLPAAVDIPPRYHLTVDFLSLNVDFFSPQPYLSVSSQHPPQAGEVSQSMPKRRHLSSAAVAVCQRRCNRRWRFGDRLNGRIRANPCNEVIRGPVRYTAPQLDFDYFPALAALDHGGLFDCVQQAVFGGARPGRSNDRSKEFVARGRASLPPQDDC